MNWYIAKVVFHISAENTPHKPQFDEQLRLIMAKNSEEAYIKARAIGITEEDSFLNVQHTKVKWEFVDVAEIVLIRSLDDGAELYSQIHEADEAKSYINSIHQKAIFIRTCAKD